MLQQRSGEKIAMVVAIPLFGSEVAPRFDCAKEIQFFHVEGSRISHIQTVEMKEDNPLHRASLLRDLKVNKLICGGIDDFSMRLLKGLGISVFPWLAGDAQKILEKFLRQEG